MTDITALAQRMKAAAEKASNGAWVKESGDGWEASCSANDQANGGFIIAHFEGPDAAANREFVQAANPANVLTLVEALEAGDTENERMARDLISRNGEIEGLRKRVEELGEIATDYGMKFQRAQDELKKMALMHRDESRTVTVKLPDPLMPAQHNSGELFMTPDNVIHGGYLNRDDVLRILAAAGIQVIEGEQKNG